MHAYLQFLVLMCCVFPECHVWVMLINPTLKPNINEPSQPCKVDHFSVNASNLLNSLNQLRKSSVAVSMITTTQEPVVISTIHNMTVPNLTTIHQSSFPVQNSLSEIFKAKSSKISPIINETDSKKTTESVLECIRLMAIKMQILKKLRMSERPHVTMQRSMLPEPLQGSGLQYLFNKFTEQSGSNEDDYYGKTERVIIIAENVEFPICLHHHEPAGCFHFKFTKDIMTRDISSAELWVYKLRDKRDNYNQTFAVSEMPVFNSTQTTYKPNNYIVSIRDTSLKNGWVKFDLTSTIRKWLWWKSRQNIHGLKISCKTCGMHTDEIPVSNDPGEKPFLVINFNTADQLRRTKKNGVCEPNSPSCCKQSFYVNFTDIGWSDWIIAPEGYYANYCSGTCFYDGAVKTNPYDTILKLLRTKSLLAPAQLAELTPCCSPVKLSPMSMLYTTSAGNIIVNTLPNMIVESCGCK